VAPKTTMPPHAGTAVKPSAEELTAADFAADEAAAKRLALPANLRRDQPLVPVDSAAGRALVAVIAILTFLAALAAGGAIMVAQASTQWRGAISNEMTIQVRPDPRRNIENDLRRATELASAVPGISEAKAMPKLDSDRLLEPWLGRGLDLVELPVPRIIVLKVQGSGTVDLAGLRQSLRRDVPSATLDDHRLWVSRLSTMANTIIIAGLAIVLLVMVAAALAVAFATRGAMAGSRDSVEVLHLVGADDDFIAREFQTRFVRLGAKGGLAGGIGAVVVIAFMGWLAAWWSAVPGALDQIEALFGSFSIGWLGYGAVLLVAATVAAIAGLVSRLTVRRYLVGMS
jgi:cell division transport system permease protein